MRRVDNFNENWTFSEGFDASNAGIMQEGEIVHLPHNAHDLPLTYFDETEYQRAFLYQKRLPWGEEFEGREVSLVCDGAMADAEVFVNGIKVAQHRDGYTPFEVRLTKILDRDNNILSIKVDGSENPEIPPFGGQIDYLTYAGIYRDIWLKITDPVSISSVKVETENTLDPLKTAVVQVLMDNPQNRTIAGRVEVDLIGPEGEIIASLEQLVYGPEANFRFEDMANLSLWTLENPVLYKVAVRLVCDNGGRDDVTIPFGYRTAEFTPEGFKINGNPLKLRGLNRHQSFPYVGYAMGRRAQERDAEILRHDLKCNVVRCSHYPQSPYFLDHCDRIGLLVIEEIPGWQHIGGRLWKAETVENVRRMVTRDWNHPSIIMWGVRVNESADDPVLYGETNALARRLDPSRATGGIRCIEHSELLEDVYTMNDFFHGARDDFRKDRAPDALRNPRDVTGLAEDVPYLVTEFNGHMFPTKRWDNEERQAEHVMRYLQVLNRPHPR